MIEDLVPNDMVKLFGGIAKTVKENTKKFSKNLRKTFEDKIL